MHRVFAKFGKHSQVSEQTDPDYAEKYQFIRPVILSESAIQTKKAKLLARLKTEKDVSNRKQIAKELWNLENQKSL